MDKLTSSILAVVNAQTGGAYKVMEAKDFIDALPEKTKTDETGVSNALQYLAERGFVDIRYSDRDTYCVCSLPKGRTFEESTGAEKRAAGAAWAASGCLRFSAPCWARLSADALRDCCFFCCNSAAARMRSVC